MPARREHGAGSKVPGAESGRRLLAVLLSFTPSRPLWTVGELADELGLNHSTLYRYIALLREVGLIDSAPDNRYRVTDVAANLAGAASAARAPLGDVALPVLTRLRDAFDETTLVARRSGWRVFTVNRVESRKPVRLQFEPGQAMSLHIGSIPRVLLANMPLNERAQFLASLDPEVRSSDVLAPEALDQVRREGVTESFEEVDEGIWGVAAAINVEGQVIGAIGCAAPIFRTGETARREIRRMIIEAAAEIADLMQDKRTPA